jgi:hypothetical protein
VKRRSLIQRAEFAARGQKIVDKFAAAILSRNLAELLEPALTAPLLPEKQTGTEKRMAAWTKGESGNPAGRKKAVTIADGRRSV